MREVRWPRIRPGQSTDFPTLPSRIFGLKSQGAASSIILAASQSHWLFLEMDLISTEQVVAEYVSSVAPSSWAFGFLTLVPWNSQNLPANVLAPEADHGEMSQGSINQMVEQHEAVVIPSVYKTRKEKRGLTRLLDYLRAAHPDAFVFLVQLPDRLGAGLTKGYLRTLMARQDALYSFGASGVLMELEGDPEGLLQKVRLELAENAAIQLRVQYYESTVTAGVPSSNELQTIEDEHDGLLWETIPQLLMPGFPDLDKRLLEFGDRVGEFRLVQQYANHQHVLLAVNGQHENVVIKTRNKRSSTAAEEVESVYYTRSSTS
ncbi:unnamed protein product [Prorocentrum cordatum]|uniref:Uncharacterized protein n=1 Tax=Prorocentrum cordatum TaxID=2364126 RepID=A0ABN9Y9L2_9DINO|nr:unnamed protein product [Polarella glacialis]